MMHSLSFGSVDEKGGRQMKITTLGWAGCREGEGHLFVLTHNEEGKNAEGEGRRGKSNRQRQHIADALMITANICWARRCKRANIHPMECSCSIRGAFRALSEGKARWTAEKSREKRRAPSVDPNVTFAFSIDEFILYQNWQAADTNVRIESRASNIRRIAQVCMPNAPNTTSSARSAKNCGRQASMGKGEMRWTGLE